MAAMHRHGAFDLDAIREQVERAKQAYAQNDTAQQIALLAVELGINPQDPTFKVLLLQCLTTANARDAHIALTKVADIIKDRASSIQSRADELQAKMATSNETLGLKASMLRHMEVFAGTVMAAAIIGALAGALAVSRRPSTSTAAPDAVAIEVMWKALASPDRNVVVPFLAGADLSQLARCGGQGWEIRGDMCYPFPMKLGPKAGHTVGWRIAP